MKAGDVVTLKSGGPRMTVTIEVDDERVSCVWANGRELREAVIRKVALKLAPDDIGSVAGPN